MKKCTKCHADKFESEFHFARGAKGGLNPKCKSCVAAYNKEWRSRDGGERSRGYTRRFQEGGPIGPKPELPGNQKKCSRCAEIKDKSLFSVSRDRKDGRHHRCKACRSEIDKAWRSDNPAAQQERYKRFMDAHPDYRKVSSMSPEKAAKKRASVRDKWKTDPQFKFSNLLRSNIISALREHGYARKYSRTRELLGCTIDEFRAHMEAQFELGMDWSNHGQFGWHVEHRVPCCAFNLSEDSEQRKCFHYSNLRPMWWKANLSKGGRTDKLLSVR